MKNWFSPTPIGDLMLRRRRMQQFGDCDIYEVKLGEDFLMSSLFHEAEAQTDRPGPAAIDREPHDVLVGGLDLGYSAFEALKDQWVGIKPRMYFRYTLKIVGYAAYDLMRLDRGCFDIRIGFSDGTKGRENGCLRRVLFGSR